MIIYVFKKHKFFENMKIVEFYKENGPSRSRTKMDRLRNTGWRHDFVAENEEVL
jgi:hypothetical protein